MGRVSNGFDLNASGNSLRNSSGVLGSSLEDCNGSRGFKDGAIVVIESPTYSQIQYGAGAHKDHETGEVNLAAILQETNGYLTVFCRSIKLIEDTELMDRRLTLNSSHNSLANLSIEVPVSMGDEEMKEE